MSETVRFTLKTIGPITRVTTSNKPGDPRLRALDDLLYWIWSWEIHIARFGESIKREWNGAFDSSKSELDRRRICSLVSLDEHLLAVIGSNLSRAVERAQRHFREIKISKDNFRALQLLRNLYDHWDKTRRQYEDQTIEKTESAEKFSREFPNGHPWKMVFEESECIFAGVIRVNAFTREIHAIETLALKLESELIEEISKESKQWKKDV